MLSFGSNIAALAALRRLNNSVEELGASSQRLASGMRINRASDDAAGLAIASALNKDTRVYSQAIRNGNDAISALAIAEGSANELTSVRSKKPDRRSTRQIVVLPLSLRVSSMVLLHLNRKSSVMVDSRLLSQSGYSIYLLSFGNARNFFRCVLLVKLAASRTPSK